MNDGRYFYPANRAHHVYCMSCDFRMRFVWADGTERAIVLPAADEPFYIQPESLHLLTVQVGDRIESKSGCVGQVAERNLHFIRNKVATGLAWIEKRNGIHFHWPESEASESSSR